MFLFDGQCFMVKTAGLRCTENGDHGMCKKKNVFSLFFLNHNSVSYFFNGMAAQAGYAIVKS